MQNIFSRRAIVKGGLIAGAIVPTLGLIANAAPAATLPALDPNDPTNTTAVFSNDVAGDNQAGGGTTVLSWNLQ